MTSKNGRILLKFSFCVIRSALGDVPVFFKIATFGQTHLGALNLDFPVLIWKSKLFQILAPK